MSTHEGEKTTTLTGLKRSEVLRQTEDGSFEFIVDESEEESSIAASAIAEEGPEPAMRALRPWKKRLLIAAPVTAVALIVIALALGGDNDDGSRSRDAAAALIDDVPGFRPYGGGSESVPKVAPAQRKSAPRPALRVEHDEFEDEFYDEEEYIEPVEEKGNRWAVRQADDNVIIEGLDPADLDPEVREEPSNRFNRQDALKRRELPRDINDRLTRPELMQQIQEGSPRAQRPFNPGTRIPPQIREHVLERDLTNLDDPSVELYDDDYSPTDPTTGEPLPDTVYEEDFEEEWEEIDEDDF